MGLEETGVAKPPVVPLEVHVRNELVEERVRGELDVDAVDDSRRQVLKPGVAGLGVAADVNVGWLRVIDRHEAREALESLLERAVDKALDTIGRRAADALGEGGRSSLHRAVRSHSSFGRITPTGWESTSPIAAVCSTVNESTFST